MTAANDSARPIVRPPMDEDGLFVQPSAYDEIQEAHTRDGFIAMFQYSDSAQGNPHTYDAAGNYVCKDCNKFNPDDSCLVVVGEISGDAGSCRHWERQYAGDPEIQLGQLETQPMASYGTTTAGGYGCHRCEYAEPANAADSEGRPLWCKRGAFHVYPAACCALNDSEAVTEGTVIYQIKRGVNVLAYKNAKTLRRQR